MDTKIDLNMGDGVKSLEKNWDESILSKVKKTLENKIEACPTSNVYLYGLLS